jgi:chemotaxis signal transduction protein
MSEGGVLILGRAAGRDLLLNASDLIEMLPAGSITPLPGPLPGIAGVILYQGEFLPVVDWAAMPGCEQGLVWATSMAVLKSRLALPLEFLSGALEAGHEGLRVDPSGDDPWAPFLSAICTFEGSTLPLLDPDKLIDWLHHRRTER